MAFKVDIVKSKRLKSLQPFETAVMSFFMSRGDQNFRHTFRRFRRLKNDRNSDQNSLSPNSLYFRAAAEGNSVTSERKSPTDFHKHITNTAAALPDVGPSDRPSSQLSLSRSPLRDGSLSA